jgi:hypothetical protein
MDCYAVLFPNTDFSRVAFFSGMPFGWGSASGFTMASGGPSPDIHVYVNNYDPCTLDTFLTIAHELVHVLQIQGMTGGGHIPGSWATYYMSHTIGCLWRGWLCDNELEKEAYNYADGGCDTAGKVATFVQVQFGGQPPCTCARPPWPTPTSGFKQALELKSRPRDAWQQCRTHVV